MILEPNFSDIVLTPTENQVFKKLKIGEYIIVDDAIAQSLFKIGLASKKYTGQDENGIARFEDLYELSDFGNRYRIWLKTNKSRHRAEWIRYIITTVIALAAIIMSFISISWQVKDRKAAERQLLELLPSTTAENAYEPNQIVSIDTD